MGRRRFLIILAILLLIAGISFFRSRRASDKVKIETATVERKQLIEVVSSSGKTEAKNQVDLTFQTGGRLAWVGVKEGDTVYAYQAIASLDARDLQKNLEKALRDYSQERNDFEEDRLVTYKDKVFNDTIKRILEKNQWDLEKAVLDVELQTIALQWSTIITPIAGIVTHIDTPIAGVNITPTATFTVADPASIVFSANIDETDIGKITPGLAAEISLDAFPDEPFEGQVTKIAFAAETSTGGATIYPVEVTFNDPRSLRAGLNGDVSITIKTYPATISIPNEALRQTDEQMSVIKKVVDRYEKVQVKTGIATDSETEIIEGLTSGDEVVVRGFEFLPKELVND
jgi:RND family efflux transporter MFP subunit